MNRRKLFNQEEDELKEILEELFLEEDLEKITIKKKEIEAYEGTGRERLRVVIEAKGGVLFDLHEINTLFLNSRKGKTNLEFRSNKSFDTAEVVLLNEEVEQEQ